MAIIRKRVNAKATVAEMGTRVPVNRIRTTIMVESLQVKDVQVAKVMPLDDQLNAEATLLMARLVTRSQTTQKLKIVKQH